MVKEWINSTVSFVFWRILLSMRKEEWSYLNTYDVVTVVKKQECSSNNNLLKSTLPRRFRWEVFERATTGHLVLSHLTLPSNGPI
jgi:hypothetical protein